MYSDEALKQLAAFIDGKNGIADKSLLSALVKEKFNLVRDRSVFYGRYFAVRFCRSKSKSFSNTVLALSVLQKYDSLPFVVCLVTPRKNYLLLANSTFLRKISHSSQALRVDNIKGSFNGSDILREFEGIANSPENFDFLFTSHENYPFGENLARLVAATNGICPKGKRFLPTAEQRRCITDSVYRTIEFLSSDEYEILNKDLISRVKSVASEIIIAAFIDNVNLRGRIIECLITSSDHFKDVLISALHEGKPLPQMFTADKLGDYHMESDMFVTETDIKTKMLFLSSNPKGYNVDKLLSFLSKEKSVYLIYIIAIGKDKSIYTRLCSPFSRQILSGTRVISHWSGRNSRGVTQYDGRVLEQAVSDFSNDIDVSEAKLFLDKCIKLGDE
ncbi:MAG: hypothetical protein VB112_02485 [Oscillospiraceae bacterium]|nr:hypothetical protein [Oscillospiraceae bacterium]